MHKLPRAQGSKGTRGHGTRGQEHQNNQATSTTVLEVVSRRTHGEPFLGAIVIHYYKHSGIGREAGTEGLIEFLEVKTVGGWA